MGRIAEGVCVYVEGVNRKSRILFSFQLLSFDDNELRLVSRSLRRRNQACKYIHVHQTVQPPGIFPTLTQIPVSQHT